MSTSVASVYLQILCQFCAEPSILNNTNLGGNSNEYQPPLLPDGYVPYPDIGFAYKVHDAQISWPVARQECIFEGGNLAVIDSYRKFRYVSTQRRSNGYTHVGIVRMYDDESWTSVKTGACVSEIPWANNEPAGNSDCVGIKQSEGGLANYQCKLRADFVCEIPIAESHNLLMSRLAAAAVDASTGK